MTSYIWFSFERYPFSMVSHPKENFVKVGWCQGCSTILVNFTLEGKQRSRLVRPLFDGSSNPSEHIDFYIQQWE